MNENVKENSIYNYLSRYGTQSPPNFEKIKKVIEKSDYLIYRKLCELANSSRIVEVTTNWFIVEIDVEENNHLVEDLERKFFIM